MNPGQLQYADKKNSPIFIIGSGRCGSTFLSNCIKNLTDFASISEFFSHITDLGRCISTAFSSEQINGDLFWRRISSPLPATTQLIKKEIFPEEWIYPEFSDRSAALFPHGISPIILTTLPHLTDDYVDLYHDLRNVICDWGCASSAAHYLSLFELLARRFEKSGWVERSGGSLSLVQHLLESFPDARFVYLVRDGRDVALSMSKHAAIRHRMESHLSRNDNSFFEYSSEIPVSMFAKFWSQQTVSGIDVLKGVPGNRLIVIKFEELIERFECKFAEVSNFIGAKLMSNIKCDLANGGRVGSNWSISSEDKAIIDTECRPGFAALREMGIYY